MDQGEKCETKAIKMLKLREKEHVNQTFFTLRSGPVTDWTVEVVI